MSAREEVWRLFDDTFVKEHDSFESFDAYLCERKVLLFRDTAEKKALQGFIILNTEDRIIEGTLSGPKTVVCSQILKIGKSIRVVIGDFFALTANYRRTSTPIISLLKYCIKTKLRNPFKQMYYFFITYSFKSYLSFSRCVSLFSPLSANLTSHSDRWANSILAIQKGHPPGRRRF